MKKILKGSKKSKRISTHSRQVITQRVKQHKRKTKKEAKKLSSAGFRKSGKTSNQNSDLPNLMPLKKKIIQSLAAKKQSSLRDSAINNLSQKTIVTINQSVVQEDPAVREQKFIDDMAAKNAPKAGPRMKHNYMKELKEVIESSDIILEVLDARDPEGCRCREMEAEILSKSGDKRIILVLNKIDLVPIEVVQLWKKKLSREYACVLFKSNTQGQTKDFGQTK
jgi:nuclear GTP-binding protein